MKVTVERLPESQVQLEIEIDPERLERSLEATYRKVASKARIAGFRPGKAPRPVVMQRIGGRPGLIREALDTLVPDAYKDAIASEDVDAIDQPQLEILEIDPVKFKATVPVRPSVDLNDYRGVRVEAEPVDVSDEEVESNVLALRRRLAVHAPAERPAEWNDFVLAGIRGEAEGSPFLNDEDAEFPLREGQVLLVPGLAEAIVGMAKGETKAIDLPVPDDFTLQSVRGKLGTFTVTVNEVKEEELPDADDDFAQQVNEEFKTIEDLRNRIRGDMTDARQAAEENRIRTVALDRLVELSTLEYPRILVEREMDRLVREGVGNDAANYQRYLQSAGRTHAEFRETFRAAADDRVKRTLILGELADVEGLTVSDEEIDLEVARLAGQMGENSERFQQLFGSSAGRDSIRRNLLSQRTLDRLAAIARGEQGAPAAGDEAPKEENAE